MPINDKDKTKKSDEGQAATAANVPTEQASESGAGGTMVKGVPTTLAPLDQVNAAAPATGEGATRPIAPTQVLAGSRSNVPGEPGGSAQMRSGLLDFSDLVEDPVPALPPGTGPRLVVLHTYVTGPAGFPLTRSMVVNVSHILGDKLMENEAQAKVALRRYMTGTNPAVREATSEEAKADMVTLPEDLASTQTALDAERARAAAAEAEVERLCQQLAEAQDMTQRPPQQ